VEQLDNPDSVLLIAGGEWKDGTVISGSVTTVSTSEFSKTLMRCVYSVVRKDFTKVRAYWVGPDALKALRNGRRLTIAIQSPPEFDLHEAVPK
jgi:hypothetical protein